MRILHRSKRAVPPPTQVSELISKILVLSNSEIPLVLSEIAIWRWPRSDLNAWIKVLNKFDGVLEELIREYDVDTLQSKPFSDEDKATITEILRFERLLLENSTNRKMFSSYDRINSLLSASDLDVLIYSLKLLLRPAQQYSAQPSVAQALSIPTNRLLCLAKRWPHLREYSISLTDLTTPHGITEIEKLPSDAREVNFTFYRTSTSKGKETDKPMDIDTTDLQIPRKTPAPPSSSTSGAIIVHLDESTLISKPEMEILADVVSAYSIPDSEKFELLWRIRTAHSLITGNEDDREKLVAIRLLAIAIYGHTHPETQAVSSLFLYEPDLIIHIAELLQVDKDIPIIVQTVAVAALDALARYRSKIQEALASVNAGVNHGILMSMLRKTVADIGNPESTVPQSFVEALLSFVTYIASHASGGNMVVGAGLIPLLIQILENRNPHRLPVISKAMQLVDNVLYSFNNAFNMFCSARGVEVLVERIAYEIDLDIEEYGDAMKSREIYGSHGEIPVNRAAVLKHILRSMHRMMQSSGTSEGLRGLVDTSILRSVRKIIEYRGLFGPSVLPLAVNIMATFVHNEPTSLAVIQEAGLPEAFYKSIEIGLEPAIEVIQAIPNAIGALCLNEVGQAQLAARPSIIPAIFSIFTSDRHLKVLLDKENAVLIGTAIDELIRHHPTLKAPVFEALISTLSKIEELGNAYVPRPDIQHWYHLMPERSATVSNNEDVTMAEAEVGAEVVEEGNSKDSSVGSDDAKSHENNIVSFMDILGRFLEGLFQHAPHCRDFVLTTDGLVKFGRLTGLSCLPYDYANSVTSDSMVQVFRTMTDSATTETLSHLAQLVNESLEATKDFWTQIRSQSSLLPLVDISDVEATNANYYFRNLLTLHVRITLMSDVFATAGYSHGRAAVIILQTLMSNSTPQVVRDLGSLHRAAIWENILLTNGLSASGIKVLDSPEMSPLDGSPEAAEDTTSVGATPAIANGEGVQIPAVSTIPTAGTEESSHESSREYNAKALKHITNGIPGSLAPFFQAMVKMFHARRTPEPAQRKQIVESSSVVAEIMLSHLRPTFTDKPSGYAYYTVVLGLMTLLLIDERTASSTLHTVQLYALYSAGGFDAIFDVCEQFMSSINTLYQIKEGERSVAQVLELTHAYGALKVVLHLLHPIISSKPLFESGQTVFLVNRDKKDTDADYFEPHNFLVRLRLASLPFLKCLWEAPWLVQAPLTVSRSVVQTVLELLNGENEEGKTEVDPMPAPLGLSRPPVSDENRIRQLMDMGFPRSAAERALLRTHNNVSAATEFLLSHPFPFPPEPQVAEQDAPATQSSETPILADETNRDPAAPEPELVPSLPVEPEQVGKSSEEWRKELNDAREPLKAGISRQALLLVDEHLSLIFDLHVAFIRPPSPHQKEAVQNLVTDIQKFSPYAYDVQEQPLANRCRLLALVLCETPSSLTKELRATLMETLLALLLSNPVSVDSECPTVPRWLAAHLLVTEALLTLADEPRSITLPKEGEPIEFKAVATGPSLTEARSIIFDFCLRLQKIPDLGNDEFLSTLRLFVLLTRNPDSATSFVKRDGISMLFGRLRSSPVHGSSSYVATILRHAIEDKSTVEHIMRHAVKRYLAQPRSRLTDVTSYVCNCSAMALRDSAVFIEVTQSLCQMQAPYSPSPQLTLKPETNEPTVDNPKIAEESYATMQVDPQPAQHVSSENSDAVIHFLISEVMKTVKSIRDPLPVSDPKVTSATVELDPSAPNPAPAPPMTPEVVQDKSQYACFLMQCLTELLFSYDVCKVAFLSFSPKRKSQTPSKDSNKYRSATVNFLLSELISYGTLKPDPATQPSLGLCNWAMSVLVALCVDTSSSPEVKEVSVELVGVRKFVLDAINKAIKELQPIESLDTRYGRLLALVDLCHRLLTVRFNSSTRKQQDDAPTHIAKVMLEKNFVATLTNALSEVDLNYPDVRSLVASILKPLEYLTKIAIKMSRSAKGKDSIAENKGDSVSSVDSDDDDDEPDRRRVREETPDLYRNSALGMYGGEMDDGHFNGDEDDEMDEDDEDDEEDEMDFAETASDDTSNTGDEGEGEDLEDTDDPGAVEGWDDEDEDEDEDDDVEEDLIAEEDGDDDHPDPGLDVHDLGDGDLGEDMWQDINEDDVDGADEDGDDEDGDPHRAPIQIVHEGDEDEPEMVSDEEEFGNDLDLIENPHFMRDVFGVPGGQAGSGLFVPRRHRGIGDDNIQVFGRARNGPPPPPEATTHPLLLDASNGNRSLSSQSRGGRHTHRIVTASNSNELLQTIEELVGGGAVQLFHHIMARGRGAGPETIRLDMPVPAGAFASLERNILGQRRNENMSTVRVERSSRSNSSNQGRDVDPLLTLQRWAEEVKILHGDFVLERAGKLSNHVALALLPEAAKLAKLKAKEAEQRRQEAEKEALLPENAAQETEAEASMLSEDVAIPEPTSDHPMEDDIIPTDVFTDVHTNDPDFEMTDATLVTNPTEAPPTDSSLVSENNSVPGPSSAEEDSPSIPQRVTVMIHGSSVDITDTGIDPTFLEALPDDMREEVLNQHVRDQQAAQVERPEDSQISAEFLDALPPEIRAEIIQQEALERSSRRPNSSTHDSTSIPAEIDPASFIASLDPTLRQAVLMEQDEGFIQSLPSHMIAEAGQYRNIIHRSDLPRFHVARGSGGRNAPSGSNARKLTPQHDAIHLLDKTGLAVLIRLLFFPQVLKKNLLFKVLLNLCENSKTRTELFNLLLNILQDGTGDLAAVDKSFAQMSVRGSKSIKSPGKSKASDYFTALALPSSQSEAVPDLIAQRCLEALTYIVTSHQMSSLFFLTEHELPASLRRPLSRKGKGKEKLASQTHYPIVLLLSLLDRQSLLKTPSIMEAVVGLLATVTRPLSALKEKTQPPTEEPKTSENVTTEPQNVPTVTSAQEEPPQATDSAAAAPSTAGDVDPIYSIEQPVQQPAQPKDMTIEAVEERILLTNPPQIPHNVLRLIVNILTVGECSGRTFQQSLALIQHLSYLPEARDVIALELKTKAQEFGHELLIELEELADGLRSAQGDVMVGSIASKFSSPSSVQAKLLRVLKTIDYMYSPKAAITISNISEEDTEKVQVIYESFRFTPLWRKLGECLAVIEEKPDTENVATVLLPLIESLMVVCKHVGSKSSSAARALRASSSPRSPSTPRESMEDLFVAFTDAHRKVLNLMVRNNPSLMSGSFSLLVHNPRVLDFDNKRNYFNQQLHRRPHNREHFGTLQLNVRRARVFEDSYQHLQRKTGDQIKYGKLSIRFYNEEGVDAGGLTREWFQILARQMFDPNNALFQPCAADKLTYQPNKNSWINSEHLLFFKFVGRVIGKAIYDGRLLDAYFARSLYRQLLNKPVDYKDVEWVDPEYYNSLCWILENDPTPLDLNFSVEADEFGVNRIVPLKDNGESIAVTQENKREFVQLSAQYRLYSSIKEQIQHLSTGFYEIIPKDLVTIFNEQELELLISGTPDIDVDEWRAATEYNGYTSSDPNIVWWWRALKSFTRDEKAKVLSFATGTSRVPLNGFVDLQGVQGVQRFSIHRAYGEADRLPQAHTCFNQIDLPQYSSYEMLRQQLLLAINEGGEGFGFV